MVNKKTKASERILFTCLILAGLLFLFAPESLANRFQFAFARIFSRHLSLSRDLTLSLSDQQSAANIVNSNKYIELRNYLANNMQLLRQERQKVEKLAGLRDKFAWKGVGFVLADVITTIIENSRCELIINRGTDDGLSQGQFVLGNHSVIATISDLDSHTARARLLTDPRTKIAVKIAQLNVNALLQGSGNNTAEIRLLPAKHKIKAGDIVFARKKPGFLETSVIAGTVEQCKNDGENPLLWDITVRPACDIEKLNNVTVIVMNLQKQDMTDRSEPNDKFALKID